MITGNGLIAKSLQSIDSDDVLFFASGVSNSLETRTSEFEREHTLLKSKIEENPGKTFVYFSTCSIYDSSKNNSHYVLHKLKMEQIIADLCKNYFILRISNAVGNGGNPNLLVNYLVREIKSNAKITLHTKATRNLIDVDDLCAITENILKNFSSNQIINLAYLQNFSIIEITEAISAVLMTEPLLQLQNEGSGYEIEVSKIEDYFRKNNLTDKEQYLINLITKYYKI
ncbi:NAD-dependent epimerase/dehydratase family protein [Chryseobacterium caseinilyticum]|uniref:NAD-dependent epimerase/dehydratase family protein n=1 Tax=Chryseobacterium caseinilyticum TaxID=2771428 RepID=A0ABR8ZHG7_9FLAO|nr:NAD-dependent epimerase/dehydratase family protein [Chryseobacterium caseinilyticum]MBD8084310.1 NAD-dependent epimerase/dehydratase family protein [Chryseobacterium caseinilyticum]